MAKATFPNSIKPTSMNITSEFQTVVTNSQSFARQARTRGGQRWKIEYNYPAMTRSEIAPLLGFIQAQNGRSGEFTIDPATSLFTNTGDTKLVSSLSPIASYASTPVGGGVVVERTSGSDAFNSSTDKIEAGTFIKFSNHDKVYMTTQALELSGAGPFFQSATLDIDSRRDTLSPKLDGDLRIDLPAIDVTGTADDNIATTVVVATLAADTAAQIATKIETEVNNVSVSGLGFSATATGSSVEISVVRRTGGSTTADGRKVYVQNLISSVNNGITGIKTDVDNYTTIGGSSPATLYFDPPLRESIDTDTVIAVAPLDSVPFRVALIDDRWMTSIDHIEHYNGFKLTFQETF
jgi:hypothetical protein